ncbi:hypothetical protein, partial [Legionella sp.]|uniref:hypothetical protein n=1 Tax=Legionella sp. TaxID=459 RepID=UPI003D0F9C34
MNKLVLFCFMLLWGVCWAEEHPQESFSSCLSPFVQFSFPQGFPATIYDGQVLRVPMHMSYVHLRRNKVWSNVSNGRIYVANVSGKCPAVTGDKATWHSGECDMVAVITGKGIGTTISGFLKYRVFGKRAHCRDPFDKPFVTPPFTTTVVRRPLSMQVIAPQNATVGVGFQYLLSNAVTNYWESVNSKAPVSLRMNPQHLSELNNLGLSFDPNDFSFKGTPNKAGSFKFLVGATNGQSLTSLVEMTINVQYNEKNKPRFKSNNSIFSATPYKKYQLNLMTLLENVPGFNITNQVTFKIDDNSKVKSGLALSAENHLVLEGEPNPALAGDMAILTVTATSNTGGDSKPYPLRIPVAYDSSKRPRIEPFELEQSVGAQFSVDLSQYLKDPAQDPSFAVKIDQIEPKLEKIDDAKAFRIQISSQNPKILEGYIPEHAVGKKYYITLHANTHTGGDSEKIRVPLQVSIDESLTPRFRQDNPQLPLLIPGQPFAHDFVANRDVWPEYENMPYELRFAEGYTPPPWLKLENNKLFSVVNVPIATKDIEV